MIARLTRGVGAFVGFLGLFGAAGCAPEIGGRASFPILSRTTLPNYYEPITTVDEKRCTHAVLFFAVWGEDANHEALITDILSKHKGDALADAELTFFSVPAIFYTQQCARVSGTVVRRTAGAQSSAQPPGVAPAKPVEVGK
jgi:hypothetical protein